MTIAYNLPVISLKQITEAQDLQRCNSKTHWTTEEPQHRCTRSSKCLNLNSAIWTHDFGIDVT